MALGKKIERVNKKKQTRTAPSTCCLRSALLYIILTHGGSRSRCGTNCAGEQFRKIRSPSNHHHVKPVLQPLYPPNHSQKPACNSSSAMSGSPFGFTNLFAVPHVLCIYKNCALRTGIRSVGRWMWCWTVFRCTLHSYSATGSVSNLPFEGRNATMSQTTVPCP